MYALRERRVHVTQEDFEMAVSKVVNQSVSWSNSQAWVTQWLAYWFCDDEFDSGQDHWLLTFVFSRSRSKGGVISCGLLLIFNP